MLCYTLSPLLGHADRLKHKGNLISRLAELAVPLAKLLELAVLVAEILELAVPLAKLLEFFF